jgi:hypothetical protein
MADNRIQTNVIRRQTYKIRLPYLYQAKHQNDELKNLGYNYRGKILQKTTSRELWGNPLQTAMIGQIESLIIYLIEQVKTIKKMFSISHEKDSISLN